MKIEIATIKTEIGRMTIYYNGNGEEMTAEIKDVVEEIGCIPNSIKEAKETIDIMYGRIDSLNVWDIEWIENL